MGFNKDGEVKVFKPRESESKLASEKESERYTIDDLVEDSKKEELEVKSEKD